MHVIKVKNVHEALPEGMRLLSNIGFDEESRNGKVVTVADPVATVFHEPCERVIFHPERDANPFFHLMEALWMVAGRNDVEFPAHYAANIANYSDDGETLNGAYGHRWRHYFGYDQLNALVKLLKKDPWSRRAVLGMWDAENDLKNQKSKDLPCNTQALFRLTRRNLLEMTVVCRSNDVIWGAYGANAVHFSFLQEFLAGLIGCGVGLYTQISNNYHAYEELFKKLEHLKDNTRDPQVPREYDLKDPYSSVEHFPIFKGATPAVWQEDLEMFMENPAAIGFRAPFFTTVVLPIYESWELHKSGDTRQAIDTLSRCAASDWRRACEEWLERRL